MHLDDGVLVDVLEDVRGVQEYAHGAGGGHREEDVQLQAVDYHRYVLPVFANLQKKIIRRGVKYKFEKCSRLRANDLKSQGT